MNAHVTVAAVEARPDQAPTTSLSDLECKIEDLRNHARVLRIIGEDTIFPRGVSAEERVKRACPEFRNYVVVVMTEDQAEALNFAVLNLIDGAEALPAAFNALPDGRQP